MALSDLQQAFLMFAAFVLPPIATWFGLGAPTDHSAIAVLGASFIGGIIAFLKEFGGSTLVTPPAPQLYITSPSPTALHQLYIKNPDGSYSPAPS
jgi:hypothetical protein